MEVSRKQTSGALPLAAHLPPGTHLGHFFVFWVLTGMLSSNSCGTGCKGSRLFFPLLVIPDICLYSPGRWLLPSHIPSLLGKPSGAEGVIGPSPYNSGHSNTYPNQSFQPSFLPKCLPSAPGFLAVLSACYLTFLTCPLNSCLILPATRQDCAFHSRRHPDRSAQKNCGVGKNQAALAPQFLHRFGDLGGEYHQMGD